MWYQSFWFTQILIIAALILAFFAFLHNKERRWLAFINMLFVFIILSALSIFIQANHNRKIARYQTVTYSFKSIKDLSDFEADKYSADVVTDADLNDVQLKEVIYKATNQLQKVKKDAKVIWLSIFDAQDADFNNLNESNPNFIAQTQWTQKDYFGLLAKSFEDNDKYKNIRIFFNHLSEK